MATREQMFLSFLHSPAVTLYSDEQRTLNAEMLRKPALARGVPLKVVNEMYPLPTPRTPEERKALLAKLARRAARPDYLRTDPWAGIDVNPWRITEDERKRFGLGRFR